MSITVRELSDDDRAWAASFLTAQAGSPQQAAHGQVHQADEQPGFIASRGDENFGIATYVITGDECELATLYASSRYSGIGTALLEALKSHARRAECRRIWLVTTTDNIDALRFYQRRGFRLVKVHGGAVDEHRRMLKPKIPETGEHGIPIRDELELELWLD